MKKIMTKILSCMLVVGLICVAPIYKASATNLFATIMRAANTMSALQMEMNHIMDKVSVGTKAGVGTEPGGNPPKVQNNLITFAIDSYIEHGTVHKQSDETVHRSNLPLTILTWMSGYGNITGVSVDGVELDSALVAKAAYDDVDISKRCMEFVTIDESVISALSDGNHKIVVRCTGPNGSGYVTYTDDFTFNLEN